MLILARSQSRLPTYDFDTQGIDAELVSLESIVEVLADEDDSKPLDGSSQQLGQAFYDRLAQRLGERILECGDRIPVITGASTIAASP
jgi:aspartate kinase